MNNSQNQPHASTSSTKLDLWTDILRSADRQNALGRKNLLVLCTSIYSIRDTEGGHHRLELTE